MIEIKENAREVPVCPHCEKEIIRLNSREVKSQFGVRFIYYCGECQKVIGVSHRKGFWMG